MQVQKSLHFKNTSSSSILSDILARFGLMMRPLSENTHSTGAELAGALSTHSEWHQWGIFSAGIDSSHTGGHNIKLVKV